MDIQVKKEFLIVRIHGDEFAVWKLKKTDDDWKELRDCVQFSTESEVDNWVNN